MVSLGTLDWGEGEGEGGVQTGTNPEIYDLIHGDLFVHLMFNT